MPFAVCLPQAIGVFIGQHLSFFFPFKAGFVRRDKEAPQARTRYLLLHTRVMDAGLFLASWGSLGWKNLKQKASLPLCAVTTKIRAKKNVGKNRKGITRLLSGAVIRLRQSTIGCPSVGGYGRNGSPWIRRP